MDSPRMSSGHSDEFNSDELHDHRNQPDSLPIRQSFETEPRPGPGIVVNSDAMIANRRRASSCAISENSVDSSNVEGILLNSVAARSNASFRPSSENFGDVELNHHTSTKQRTRRMTRSSVMSSARQVMDEEAGSQVSFAGDNEEDVCFPMIKSTETTDIDFLELDVYAQANRNNELSTNRFRRQRGSVVGNRAEAKVDYNLSWEDSEKFDNLDENGNVKDKGLYDSIYVDRFSFFSADAETTFHAPDLASLVDEEDSFKDLFDESNGTWWLDCLDPSDAEMKVLAKSFGIHPLTAEDIRTEESREKVELFKSYYFVCFHTFDSDHESETFLDDVNMYFVVFKSGIISFHFSPVQHTTNVRRRIRQLQDYVTVSSDWICYALIDDIVDSFAPIIREVEIEADVIEDSVFVARENDFGRMLRRIGEARKKVMTLLRLLFGKADVIKMFAKRCNERWDNAPRNEIGLYLGDIQDHIITMYQNLTVYEKIFSRSHGNYMAQLQVIHVTSNNRVTRMLGRVTLIGTVLVPLNLVTGLFGMNVRVPGVQGPNLAWFFGIIGFMILFVAVVAFVARRFLSIAEAQQEEPLSENPSGSSIKSGGSLFARARRLER